MTHPLRVSLLLLSAVAFGVGCKKDETAIRTYTAPKDVPAPQVASTDQPSSDQVASDGADQNAAAPITWTVPAGWKQVPSDSDQRYATFDVSSDDPAAQLTVVPLSAEAAAVLPNVNRWAGQLKLPEVSDAQLSRFVEQTQVSGEPAQIVDMTGSPATGTPPKRLLAAIIPHDGRTWFFTLKAPEPIVAAQKANFGQFIHSIQFPAGSSAQAPAPSQANPADAHGQPAAEPYKLVKWKTPEDWQEEQPGSNLMRVTSFRIGSGDDKAEVIVARIPQGQTGSFIDNINRWRGEVGLEPVQEQTPGDLKPTQVAGHPALSLSLTGPKVGSEPPKQVTVVMDIEGSDFFFVKILGPQSVVSRQQDRLKQFLDSLQFEPQSK